MGNCITTTQRENVDIVSENVEIGNDEKAQLNNSIVSPKLKQSKIDQNDIKSMKQIAASANISNPWFMLITPTKHEKREFSTPNKNMVVIAYKTHYDMREGIIKTIRTEFHENNFNGVIVLLKGTVSVSQCESTLKANFFFDQNNLPKHILSIKKDIHYRLAGTPWILDISQCSKIKFVSDCNSKIRHYENDSHATKQRSIINVTQTWFNFPIKMRNLDEPKTECENKATHFIQHNEAIKDCDIDAKNQLTIDTDQAIDYCNLSAVYDIKEEKQSILTTSPHPIYSSSVMKISRIIAKIDHIAYKDHYSSFDVSRKLSSEIAPYKIKERIPNIYNYIIKSVALQGNHEFDTGGADGKINIFNCGLHNKNTNEMLYLVATPFTLKNYTWQIKDDLFTKQDIKDQYNIIKLPQSWRLQHRFNVPLEQMQCFLQNENNFQRLINITRWEKIPVYKKNINTERRTLSMIKKEFIHQFKQFQINAPNIIPIVMPYTTPTRQLYHHVEFVQVCRIKENFQILISYTMTYINKSRSVEVSGIHLDKWFIQNQHQLMCPDHMCQCLSSFRSNQAYDHLLIGNPDKHENNVERYKKECQEKTQFIKDMNLFLQKMKLNVANISMENVQMLIDKTAKLNTMQSDRNADYSLDLRELLNADETPRNGYKLSTEEIMEINNFYFHQTLNPMLQPILPHPIHIQTHSRNDAVLMNAL